jgi:hypothetical protein
MRVKARATVNASIPEVHRIFFEVSWRLGAALPPATLYMCASRQWSVSVLLDAACKAGGVRNPNASTADSALRLHVYSNEALVFRDQYGVSASPSHGSASGGAGSSTTAGEAEAERRERQPLPFSTTLVELESVGVLTDGGSVYIALGNLILQSGDTKPEKKLTGSQ